MTILVNGEAAECAAPCTVAEWVARRGLSAATTLVEHNGEALRRQDWAGQALEEGDRLEILQVAAGG